MAFRRLGAKVALLVFFALVVLVLQMIAVSRINTPARLPWEFEGEGGAAPVVVPRKRRREEGRTEQPPPLEHVSIQKSVS